MSNFSGKFRMPAEWEPHWGTLLAWPHGAEDWPGKFAPIQWVFAEIVRRVAASERVLLLVEPDAESHVRSLLMASGQRLANTLAEQALPGVEAGDVYTLRELTERVATQSDVVYCRIFDRSGLLLAASGIGGGRVLAADGRNGPIEIGPEQWAFSAPVAGLIVSGPDEPKQLPRLLTPTTKKRSVSSGLPGPTMLSHQPTLSGSSA